MARPRKNAPADSFTSTEVAVGAGLSQRAFGFLVDRGLAPEPSSPLSNRSATRSWDSFGVSHGALIGALHSAGVELLLAAKLAEGYARETGTSYGYFHSRLDRFLQGPLNPRPGHLPWVKRDGDEKLATHGLDDDFWLHHLLRTRSEIYRIGQSILGDVIIEIVDRQYVFQNSLDRHFKNVLSTTGVELPAEPTCRVKDWERGGDARVVLIGEEVGLNSSDPDFTPRLTALEREFAEHYKNAIGLLRVNISLAIRNAFDAIHDHRMVSKTSIDWTATARPPPGRYEGCDLQGYPLDPEHPWNKDLPPVERAKRLLEIEEYIDNRDAKTSEKSDSSDTS